MQILWRVSYSKFWEAIILRFHRPIHRIWKICWQTCWSKILLGDRVWERFWKKTSWQEGSQNYLQLRLLKTSSPALSLIGICKSEIWPKKKKKSNAMIYQTKALAKRAIRSRASPNSRSSIVRISKRKSDSQVVDLLLDRIRLVNLVDCLQMPMGHNRSHSCLEFQARVSNMTQMPHNQLNKLPMEVAFLTISRVISPMETLVRSLLMEGWFKASKDLKHHKT